MTDKASDKRSFSPFSPPAAPGSGQRIGWSGLTGGGAAVAVAETTRRRGDLTLIIAADSASGRRWVNELNFFAPDIDTYYFPDWETLAYDAFSPHEDITSERLHTLP